MSSQIWTLLAPRRLSASRSPAGVEQKHENVKRLFFAVIGLAFWLGIFAAFFRVLLYFQGVEGFGDILANKLLSMVLVTFMSLLVFSGIITSLSKLYLSRDLDLVHSLPVLHHRIFAARWIESTVDSSWMVLVFALPVFLSYGIAYGTGPGFYLNLLPVLVPFCVIASAVSAILVMVVVLILPANRFRTIVAFLGLSLFVLAYVAVRVVQPERLVDPDEAASVMSYLSTLNTPSNPWLPSTWATDSVIAALAGDWTEAWFNNGLAIFGAGSLVYLAVLLSRVAYFRGVTKAQVGRVRNPAAFKSPRKAAKRHFAFVRGPTRAFLVKEVRIFFRDQTQWPQVFLMAALVGIYLYNFKVLPLEKSPLPTIYMQNLFSFLNMALAGFVLTALAARFAYPAVSMEREAFWIVRCAPVDVGRVLWIKFFTYLVPLWVLSLVLVVATNILLNVTPFMMWLSIGTVFCIVPGIVAMGIGLGAAYPNFVSENPAQSVTSFGGLLYMILSAGFIGLVIVLEAGPVYRVFMSGVRGFRFDSMEWAWLLGAFAGVFVLCILAVFLPMRFGRNRLRAR
ncbi:MAG: putative ABC transporter permease subunit [Desulfatibacillaceae bacterium]